MTLVRSSFPEQSQLENCRSRRMGSVVRANKLISGGCILLYSFFPSACCAGIRQHKPWCKTYSNLMNCKLKFTSCFTLGSRLLPVHRLKIRSQRGLGVPPRVASDVNCRQLACRTCLSFSHGILAKF
jgi:hypothetical protein